MVIKIEPQDATADAFEHWDSPGFPRSITALRKKYFNAGSRRTWKKFKYAVAIYKRSRSEGATVDQALSDAKASYPMIVLNPVSYK